MQLWMRAEVSVLTVTMMAAVSPAAMGTYINGVYGCLAADKFNVNKVCTTYSGPNIAL